MNQSETLRQLAKQLTKNKFLIAKPTQDVFLSAQAFILLVKGVKTKDWLLAQQLMSCGLQPLIEQVINMEIEQTNMLQCRKLFGQIPIQQSLLGKQLYLLLDLSLKHLESAGTKYERSKSTVLPRKSMGSAHQGIIPRQPSITKIGSLLKAYKDDIQRMMNNRQSLKKSPVIDRNNRHLEQLKEQIKKINKNSYFVSPRKIQYDLEKVRSNSHDIRLRPDELITRMLQSHKNLHHR